MNEAIWKEFLPPSEVVQIKTSMALSTNSGHCIRMESLKMFPVVVAIQHSTQEPSSAAPSEEVQGDVESSPASDFTKGPDGALPIPEGWVW